MLGGFSVSIGARTIGEGGWQLRKAAGLVKLLALEPGQRMHRGRAKGLLWPQLGEEAAANNLRGALHAARRTLEPASADDFRYLRLEGDMLALCPDGALWIDVEVFEWAAAAARRQRNPEAYRAAVGLYAGDLLPGDLYEPWAEDHREWLRREYLALLVESAALHEERGELGPAAGALRRVLESERGHEGAHAGLMRLYALRGDRRGALAQYKLLRTALSCELGIEPTGETKRLREEIAAGTFPPSRTPPRKERPPEGSRGQPPHNLAAARTSFVGREREVPEVERLLAMTRLLTLTGVGGSGKTRLALEVAAKRVGAYRDGAWLVGLAGLSSGEMVAQEVAEAFGVREHPGRPLLETLAGALREKDALLVLDNCEHLVYAAARLADRLLDACPSLRILATSREPLNVTGEATWRVPSLDRPDAWRSATVEELSGYGSVRLFVERARRHDPGFVLTARNAPALAKICRELDGIPLAIELAAARTGTFGAEQVSRRLSRSLELLTAGDRMAPPRQRTLKGALDWSYDLLSGPERKLFGRLSVFAGGFVLEAAQTVAGGEGVGREAVPDLLSMLVDKSMVVAGEGKEGAPRYRLLEPVRQYGRDKLEGEGEACAVRRRHAAFFLTLAERAERESDGPGHAGWLDRLEAEHDDLRAALSWSLTDGGDAELGLGLAGALWLFWFTRGHSSEGRGWLEAAVHRGRSPAARAKALNGAAWISMFQGDYEVARTLLEESLSLYRELEDEEGIASSLTFLGYVALLGRWHDIPVADLLEEALALKPRLENRRTVANTLVFAGLDAFLLRGDWNKGAALHEEALALFREMEAEWGINICLTNLGLTAAALGRHERATALMRELMQRSRELDDKLATMYAFFGLACVADSRGHAARAARLWGVSEGMREAAGIRLPPTARHVMEYESRLTAARARLGDGAFEQAWAEGKATATGPAVAYALSEQAGPAQAASATPRPPRVGEPEGLKLTRREREIAVLVGRGLTNGRIALELALSRRTVDAHLRKILKKLGLRSRAQVASWVANAHLHL